MLLELKRNKDIKETCVTVEYRERDKQVNSLVDYVSHLNKMDKLVMANAENSLYQVNLQDILYMESVDRRTFGYTAEKTYELNCKLYEIEELYQSLGFIRISKSCIVNLQKIHALKPDYGGKILVTMENKEKLYISRQYAPVIKEKLGIGGKNNERISKKVPDKISLYTTIYMVAFTVFSLLNGTDSIPTVKLLQGLFIGACIGSWSEFSFGKCIISEMSLRKRTWLFVIPISLLLFATAVIFQWAASPNDYLKVFCILLLYWLFCILVLELSHRAKGRHYTIKLKAYQSESSHEASDAPHLVAVYDVTDNKNATDK